MNWQTISVFQMNDSFCNNYQMLTIKIIIDIAMVQKSVL